MNPEFEGVATSTPRALVLDAFLNVITGEQDSVVNADIEEQFV